MGTGGDDGFGRGRRVARRDVHVLRLPILRCSLLGCCRRSGRRGLALVERVIPAGVAIPVALALPLLPAAAAALFVAAIPVPRGRRVVPAAAVAARVPVVAAALVRLTSRRLAAVSCATTAATIRPRVGMFIVTLEEGEITYFAGGKFIAF